MGITPFESRCLFGVHGTKGRRYNNLASWKGREKYSQAGLCRPWGEPSHGSLCATRRTVVNDSLLQCPLKSHATMARDKTIVLSGSAGASRVSRACGVPATGEIAAPVTEDYPSWRGL